MHFRTTENGKKPIAADVSAQVYSIRSRNEKSDGGKNLSAMKEKYVQQWQATAGDTIVYEDKMISAMFFSTSNGKTETAQNFSGNDIPYLQSVESPGEGDVARKVERKTEMTLAEWNRMIGSQVGCR